MTGHPGQRPCILPGNVAVCAPYRQVEAVVFFGSTHENFTRGSGAADTPGQPVPDFRLPNAMPASLREKPALNYAPFPAFTLIVHPVTGLVAFPPRDRCPGPGLRAFAGSARVGLKPLRFRKRTFKTLLDNVQLLFLFVIRLAKRRHVVRAFPGCSGGLHL